MWKIVVAAIDSQEREMRESGAFKGKEGSLLDVCLIVQARL